MMKESTKRRIFTLFRFLLIILLILKAYFTKDKYYREPIIFITLETFGILIFYWKKEKIKSLEKIIGEYLLFCLFLVEISSYFLEIIEVIYMLITIDTLILIFIVLICSINKKKCFFIWICTNRNILVYNFSNFKFRRITSRIGRIFFKSRRYFSNIYSNNKCIIYSIILFKEKLKKLHLSVVD